MVGGLEGGRVFSRRFSLFLSLVTSLPAAAAAAWSLAGGVTWGTALLDLVSASVVLLALAARRSSGLPWARWLPAAAPLAWAAAYLGAPVHPALLAASALARGLLAVESLALSARALGGVDPTLAQLALTAGVVVLLGAAGVYAVEEGRGGIGSFLDALWWAMATATTVGYGDVVPSTTAGRLIAMGLMVVGIGFLGVFLSDMAARLARAVAQEELMDDLPVLEREKRLISRAILRIEDLSPEEVEVLINKIRVLHVLATASPGDVASVARGMAEGARLAASRS